MICRNLGKRKCKEKQTADKPYNYVVQRYFILHDEPPSPLTSAFISSGVVVSAVGTLSQTLSIVPDGFRVVTHSAVVKARSVTRGTIRMAAHALLWLGIVAIRTITHALTLM